MTEPDPVPGRPQVELEAAVAAHRRAIVLLLSLLMKTETTRHALTEMLDQQSCLHDASEDPGMDVDPAFAMERRMQRDFNRMLEDAGVTLPGPR